MQRVTAGLMGEATKAGYAEELWDMARIPIDKFKKLVLTNEFGGAAEPSKFVEMLLAEQDVIEKGVPMAASPENFLVAVTGGH